MMTAELRAEVEKLQKRILELESEADEHTSDAAPVRRVGRGLVLLVRRYGQNEGPGGKK